MIMRKLTFICVFLIAVPAFGQNLLINGDWGTGDETGWTRWGSPWGSVQSWDVTYNGPTPPEGTASVSSGSIGWYQVVPAASPGLFSVSADWAGSLNSGWAEIMLFEVTAGTSEEDIVSRIDMGNASDILYKKDSWGLNPPDTWDWEPAELSIANVVTDIFASEWVVVALKVGSGGGGATCSFDNIILTPEPTGLALLGLGSFALLRWRRSC
jgi:hypothetical protein